MAFVTTLHLQASSDAALSCKPVRPVTKGGHGTTPTKGLETFLNLPTLGMAVESAALMAAYRLLRRNLKNLGVGHNQIWVKADKMDNKFSMIKDHEP